MFTDEIKSTLHETAFASFKSLLNDTKRTQVNKSTFIFIADKVFGLPVALLYNIVNQRMHYWHFAEIEAKITALN